MRGYWTKQKLSDKARELDVTSKQARRLPPPAGMDGLVLTVDGKILDSGVGLQAEAAQGGSRLIECVQCGRRKRGGAQPFINLAYCLGKETTRPSHVRDVPRAKRDDDRKLLGEVWETMKQDVCQASLLKSNRRDHIRNLARNLW